MDVLLCCMLSAFIVWRVIVLVKLARGDLREEHRIKREVEAGRHWNDSVLSVLLIAVGLSLFAASSALAQQQPPNPQQQIEQTIGNLFITNTNLSAQLAALQAELAKANARIKELEPKPEPK